jgi:hypothetical protein
MSTADEYRAEIRKVVGWIDHHSTQVALAQGATQAAQSNYLLQDAELLVELIRRRDQELSWTSQGFSPNQHAHGEEIVRNGSIIS